MARHLRRSPTTLVVTDQSFDVSAGFPRIPTPKMARSSSFTFLPSSSNSLMQEVMSLRTPWIAPCEYGVLCLAMCSAKARVSSVSSATALASHLPLSGVDLVWF